MGRISFPLRLLTGLCLALSLGLCFAVAAFAAWSGGGSGTASSLADTMPSGNQPVAVVAGTSVTLRWTAADLPGDYPVAGYVVQRFNAVNGDPAVVGSTCSGTVTATTCTESSVPAGTWDYTDTPVQDNWTGGQSSMSSAVTVP